MKKLFCTLLFILFIAQGFGQVGIGTNSPNSSSALEIKDTTRGILLPRMKNAQRLAILNPAEGLMLYQTDAPKGYWYFDGTQWKNIGTSSAFAGGKRTIVISDTITNAQAQAQFANEYGPNTEELRIIGCANLTSIDLTAVATSVDIFILDNPVLQSVNLSNLVYCDGGLTVTDCPALTSLNLSSLKRVAYYNDGGFDIYNTGLTSLILPELKRAIGGIYIAANPFMTNVSFPKMTATASVGFYNNTQITSISLPLLSVTGGFYIDGLSALSSLSFPSLTALNSLTSESSISNCSNLTSISFNNLASITSGFFITYTKLPVAQINYLLHKFATITPAIINKAFNFSPQFPSAPPSGQGIIDKNILIGNGNTVQTD